ncbi:hypothetical protein V8E55_011959 [Tylopilus felleus]
MGLKSKFKSTNDDHTANDNTAKTLWRSKRSARSTGGALRQMEYIESFQTAPRPPQNAEVCRIKDTLSQQPENSLAPLRKKARGPKIPYDAPAPPSPILPKKQHAGSNNSFGFYGGKDFNEPPFTQQDRCDSSENSVIDGISKGIANLRSDDWEGAGPQKEDGPQSALTFDYDDEPHIISKRRGVRQLDPVVGSEEETTVDDSTVADAAMSLVSHGKRYSGKDEQPHGSSGATSGRVWASIPFPRPMVLTDVQMAHSRALHGKPRHDKINVQAQGSDEGDHSRSSTLPKTTHSSALATLRAKQYRNSGKVQSLSSVIDHPNMKASNQAPARKSVLKTSSSKHPASPPTIMERKVAKKPSMITSCGRSASEPHDNSDPEAPNDVLLDHHRCNGAPRAPDPVYPASIADKAQANCGAGPSTAVQGADSKDAQDSLIGKPRGGGSDDPTTLKFYDTALGKGAIEFITQAIAELEEDGVHLDESIQRKHQYHMCDFLFEDLVLELYNSITEETKYIHGDTDTEGKFNNFSSVALRDLCVSGYYIGKSSLAVTFPATFSTRLPAGALAFAATTLTAAVDEYSTSSFIPGKFRHDGYSKVNRQFLEMNGNIEKVPHCLQELKAILKSIAVHGCARNPAVAIQTGSMAPHASGQQNFITYLD